MHRYIHTQFSSQTKRQNMYVLYQICKAGKKIISDAIHHFTAHKTTKNTFISNAITSLHCTHHNYKVPKSNTPININTATYKTIGELTIKRTHNCYLLQLPSAPQRTQKKTRCLGKGEHEKIYWLLINDFFTAHQAKICCHTTVHQQTLQPLKQSFSYL